MNDFYLTDNLKKFKNFINKNNYIISELDYIEDYFIIKK